MNRVSLLMPICNQGDEARMTIASAKEAIGDLPHEIIVCDDQCTDNSTRGLPSDVIVLHPPKRLGCTGSRKLLEKHATGDMVIWSDPHCRYPVDGLKKLAIAAEKFDGIVQPMTRSMTPGSVPWYGSKYAINERGLVVPKSTRGAHPVQPALYGSISVARREVFESMGGWPHLPGYWGCADTIFSILAWIAGVQIVVASDIMCIHKFAENRRHPFSTLRWHHAANAHWMHKSLFPEHYELFWRPHLLKHPKWQDAELMRLVDEQLTSRRFRKFAAFVASKRLPGRTEAECFRQLLNMEPPVGGRIVGEGSGRLTRAEREDALAWLAEHDGERPVESILDVGAGDGTTMEIVGERYPDARVYGVDSVPERVADAKTRGHDVRIHDGEKLPFMDSTFDLVTCLHALQDYAEPQKVVAEMNRAMKPGGQALIVVPRRNRPAPGQASRFPRQKDIVYAVSQGGLEVEDCATRIIHDRLREIRVLAKKLLVPHSDYVAQQVRIAPGNREHKFVREERLAALDWLADLGGVKIHSVLDVGPRDGYIMNVIKEKGVGTVQGIEISPPAAAWLQRQGFDVLEGDMRDMPYEDGNFDLVTCLHTLEHCPEPEKALTEMWRVVKSGGYLYVVVPRQSGVNGERKGAHYSYFATEAALDDMMREVAADCTTTVATGIIKNEVREIRMAARKE